MLLDSMIRLPTRGLLTLSDPARQCRVQSKQAVQRYFSRPSALMLLGALWQGTPAVKTKIQSAPVQTCKRRGSRSSQSNQSTPPPGELRDRACGTMAPHEVPDAALPNSIKTVKNGKCNLGPVAGLQGWDCSNMSCKMKNVLSKCIASH